MEENETQEVVTEAEGLVDETEIDAPEEKTTEEPKVERPAETLEQREARLARQLEQTRKKLGKEEPKEKQAKSDALDDTTLDYLDLKGVSEPEDIDIVEKIMQKTGMSAREALKDDYVISKLAANKTAREVKEATPSSVKRNAGVSADAVSRAVAKFEKDGTMPDDFELRNKVVDALVARDSNNAPSWHK